MSTPYTSGDASIARRWLFGTANVLWIGDSIGAAFENRLLQVLRVNPAGIAVRGGSCNFMLSSAATAGNGALGATGLLAESNYSLFATEEVQFNGTTLHTLGLPAALDLRITSNSGEPLLLAGRSGLLLNGFDWLASATSPSARFIVYRNASSSTGIVRHSVRGSSSTLVPRGVGHFLNLASTSPQYLADDVPFSAPSVGEDIAIESQSFDGAAPATGSNYVLCCTLITSGQGGFTYIPASVGGWDILHWTNTAVISDAALAGMLPLLGVTDVVISLGQNNPGNQSAAQFQASLLQLVARLRVASPEVSIVFLPTYDTNNAGTGPHLAGFADAHYAAQQQTPNSCLLNLYKAAGVWSQLNALSCFTDGVHPSESGKIYFLQTIQGLLDILLADVRTTAAGRYARQQDIEDLFGRANVAAWAQLDSSGAVDLNRIQRALDYADGAIDDFFRGGPYGSPLLLGASRATVATWAATIAGARLYQGRSSTSSSGPATSTSVSITTGTGVTASVTQAIDPYAALVATVRAQMARCKAGATAIDASGAITTTAPCISSM